MSVPCKGADDNKGSLNVALELLDKELLKSDTYVAQRQQHINHIQSTAKDKHSIEQQYWTNAQLYDEYYVFDPDSAMAITRRNIRLATLMGDNAKQQEWRIKQSFILAATGLLKEAEDMLNTIDATSLPRQLKALYYNHSVYLLAHMIQYVGQPSQTKQYQELHDAMVDSLNKYITPNDEQYLWSRLNKVLGTSADKEVEQKLLKAIAATSLDSREDAIKAYALAQIYHSRNSDTQYMEWLAKASVADIRCANREIAALEELAKRLYAHGDYVRAYEYIKYCHKQAILYKNRVRLFSTSSIQEKIFELLQSDINQKQDYIRYMFYALVLLSIGLVIGIIMIVRDKKRLAHSNNEISKQRDMLVASSEELAKSNADLKSAGETQSQLNKQLMQTVHKLNDICYLHEEYIGYVFSLCLDYVSRFENFRKDINRKMRVNMFKEVLQMTEHNGGGQMDIKTFYKDFDAMFLNIYPTFIDDFNALLREEERITPKENELLNTELRIYALCRLGITDSVKIAKFLQCSVQTVYNNRLRTRSKSYLDKDEFEERIKTLSSYRENTIVS